MSPSEEKVRTFLPPSKLRSGGPRYKDDELYVQSGRRNVRLLAREAGLTVESRVLDVGCGPGRLLTGIMAELGGVRSYVGIDVDRRALDWADKELADPTKGIAFRHVDVRNERYNKRGSKEVQGLPAEDASFDLVVLLSVFSHMWLRDITTYCSEFARVLAPGGRVYLTAFVEDGVPDEVENPPDYHRTWSGPLHCVRLNRQRFEQVVREAGLVVHGFRYRHTNDGQSSYVLGRADEGFSAKVARR